MFTVVTTAMELREALKEIEEAERNGFMFCQAVFNLKRYGQSISECVIEYTGLIEKAHPTDGNFNWGVGQGVTKRYIFSNGALIPKE